jgi:hypothetical protein
MYCCHGVSTQLRLNIHITPYHIISYHFSEVATYSFLLLHTWYLVFNCNWVDTRWQQCSIYLQTNSTKNTENGTYIRIKTFYRLICEVRAVPRLCELYYGICFKTEEKYGKHSVRVAAVHHKQTQYNTRTMNSTIHRRKTEQYNFTVH